MKWDFLRPLISQSAFEIISDARREQKCAQVERKQHPLAWGKLVNCRLRLVTGKCALRRLRRYHCEAIAPPTLFLHNVGGALFPLGYLVRKEDDFWRKVVCSA